MTWDVTLREQRNRNDAKDTSTTSHRQEVSRLLARETPIALISEGRGRQSRGGFSGGLSSESPEPAS